MKVVIIGGGSAGTSCAVELRKRSKEATITIFEGTEYREYSPCALPYVLAGEIPSFDDIFIFTDEDYERHAIVLKKNARVESIDTETKTVRTATEECPYDVLIIATGSEPTIPFEIEGDYFTLRTLADAKRLEQRFKEKNTLVVVGGGLIGIETAQAALERGMSVQVIEADDRIMRSLLDHDMERRLRRDLDIPVRTSTRILHARQSILQLKDDTIRYDAIVIATGLTPTIRLAQDAGLNVRRGIVIDDDHKTSDPSIYAVGDCCEPPRRFEEPQPAMLGTLAFQAAPTIARSILNEPREPRRVLGAAISRIGKTIVASSGLTHERAQHLGIDAYGAIIDASTRSGYYPGDYPISVKLVARRDGVIIGGQIIGREDIAGRINLITLAITHEHTLTNLERLETVYNPASAPIHEPITVAAQTLIRKLEALR